MQDTSELLTSAAEDEMFGGMDSARTRNVVSGHLGETALHQGHEKELYSPLNLDREEIRVLILYAGTDDEAIQCSLRTVSLRDDPSYETVSYVWGDKSIRSTIFIGDNATDVPASSSEVLRRMRYPDRDRTLWIDAVCINQEDVVERGSQVGMMHTIYAKGARNLIWLGNDDGSTEQALESIKRILLDAERETDGFTTFGTTVHDQNGASIFSEKPFSEPFDGQSVLQFFASKWFLRLWVVQYVFYETHMQCLNASFKLLRAPPKVQGLIVSTYPREVVLSPDNICYRGPWQLPLQDVLRTAVWLTHKNRILSFNRNTGLLNAGLFADYANQDNALYLRPEMPRPGLLSLFWSLARFQAWEPRDRVYAVLGMYRKFCPDKQLPPLLQKPDYSKPVADILRDAARCCIDEEGDLHLLWFTEGFLGDDHDPKFASWVPQLHRGRSAARQALPVDPSADDGVPFRQPSPNDLSDKNVLHAKGFIVGYVDRLAPVITQDSFSTCEGMLEFFASAATARPTDHGNSNDTVSADAASTLASCNDWRGNHLSKTEAHTGATQLMKYIKTHSQNPPQVQDAIHLDKQDPTRVACEYRQTLWNGCKLRRLFSIASGILGLGPSKMREGDIIAVLYGCGWPVVLRRRESGDDRFQFVGCCFVESIMHGEATREHRASGRMDEHFLIT